MDLASQDAGTGAAEIGWEVRHDRVSARVDAVRLAVGNADVVDLAGRVDLLGIDAPLGWPVAFHDLLTAQRAGTVEPEVVLAAMREKRLTHRVTDHEVHRQTGLWPLSVSADLIAYPAMRAAVLLAMIDTAGHPVSRSGIGSAVIECYPAAALRRWDLPMIGAKKKDGVTADLYDRLRRAAPWLDWDPGVGGLCGRSHDALDAVIVALVAGAAVLGRTGAPAPDRAEVAAVEGWIHLPDRDFLARPGRA